jgi:prepilin-type N-terminal cleavage/methylation domain-containing protein
MKHRWSSAGFTLVETLVVIAVVSAVTAAVATMIVSFYKGNAYLLEQTAALESARRGVYDASRMLREASYGDDGTYPITSAATSSIVIYADIDRDRSVERIRYVLQGTTLFRVITNPVGTPPTYPSSSSATSTVAVDVRNGTSTPTFVYFNDAGQQLSSTSTPIADIRAVRIQLLVDINPTRAPTIFSLNNYATFRNLR